MRSTGDRTSTPKPAHPPGAAVLLDNIGALVTNEPGGRSPAVGDLGVRHGAAVVIADGVVAWIGPATAAPPADRRVDCRGGAVLPGFVDSHAHLVFAGDRSAEFAARMAGETYSAGGITSTVAATRAASDHELGGNLARLAGELTRSGVTTFEVKSGYGLTVADEQRSVRLAAQVTREVTFLGAHVPAPEFGADRAGYLELVTGPMLAACAPHARWIDVFCDVGAFDPAEAQAVLQAGRAAGLGARIHANQLRPGGGVEVGVRAGAASVDHCTHLSEADVDLLASAAPSWFAEGPGTQAPAATDATGGTVATLLPGAEFSTRSPYPDARRLLRTGAVVALATDCNPGTSYTTSMPLCIALAVREMHLSPAEATWAATLGGAIALRRPDVGRVRVGGAADLVVLTAPSPEHLAYRPGVDLIGQVWRAGMLVHQAGGGPSGGEVPRGSPGGRPGDSAAGGCAGSHAAPPEPGKP